MFKRIVLLLATLVLLPQLASAQDSMDLTPTTNFVETGASFELDLGAAFSSAVIGGEVRVEYDPAVVQLEAVDWNVAYGDDPLLRCPPNAGAVGARGCEGRSEFVALGHVSGLPTGDVGDLVFSAIGEGETTVRLVAVSPFADPMGNVVTVDLGLSDVTVVPEPGVSLALASGGLMIGLVGRRRSPSRAA